MQISVEYVGLIFIIGKCHFAYDKRQNGGEQEGVKKTEKNAVW